jgi:two-component system LytT family response regulator
VVEECTTGPETVRAIRDHHPDLLFLDVQLPGQSGIAALAEVPDEIRPMVIFVTAYDAHALRAFDFEAADYLLKPYSDTRFRTAVDRALARIDRVELRELRRRLRDLADGGEAAEPATAELGLHQPLAKHLPVRIADGVRLIDVADVLWIEADRDYARVHARSGDYLLRTTMGGLERRLDPARFVRIHRSTIANVAYVSELRGGEAGDGEVVLHTGTRLRASERGRRLLLRALHIET